jgi:hypothetical protein
MMTVLEMGPASQPVSQLDPNGETAILQSLQGPVYSCGIDCRIVFQHSPSYLIDCLMSVLGAKHLQNGYPSGRGLQTMFSQGAADGLDVNL